MPRYIGRRCSQWQGFIIDLVIIDAQAAIMASHVSQLLPQSIECMREIDPGV